MQKNGHCVIDFVRHFLNAVLFNQFSQNFIQIYGQTAVFDDFVRNRHFSIEPFTDKAPIFIDLSVNGSDFESSPNLCVKYFSQAQVVQGMRMHPCLSTITLEGAVKGAPSAHLEEVPLTAPERVIHLTQLLVFVVPLPIF